MTLSNEIVIELKAIHKLLEDRLPEPRAVGSLLEEFRAWLRLSNDVFEDQEKSPSRSIEHRGKVT